MELKNESKTLFIPLLGKALMSKNNVFLKDEKAFVLICEEGSNKITLKSLQKVAKELGESMRLALTGASCIPKRPEKTLTTTT